MGALSTRQWPFLVPMSGLLLLTDVGLFTCRLRASDVQKVGGPGEPAQGVGSTLKSHLVNVQKGGGVKWWGQFMQHETEILGQLCLFFFDCVTLEYNIATNMPSFPFPNCCCFYSFSDRCIDVEVFNSLCLCSEIKYTYKYSLERFVFPCEGTLLLF